MLLSPTQVTEYCQRPASTADLQAGQALERAHRLHLKGEKQELLAFLTERTPGLLVSAQVLEVLHKVAKPATATLYDGCVQVLDKIFTAAGGTKYFEFTDPALAEDFDAYLADTSRNGQGFEEQFRTDWGGNRLTGFQGVLLVDFRQPTELVNDTEVPSGLPEPFFQYVPSGLIRDMQVTGNRIEYLILQGATADEYFCWDDAACYRVENQSGAWVITAAAPHGQPRVPACPITRKLADSTRPVRRTSPLAKSLVLADTYLADFNNHELGKYYHAHPKMWSKGVKCDFKPPTPTAAEYAAGCWTTECSGGYVTRYAEGIGQQLPCPTCKGRGAYVPTGPDKVIIVEQAKSKNDPDVLPVAGYIVPDLTSLEYLGDELDTNEIRIEKAVLGKAGLLEMQSKAESGLAKQADLRPLTDRLNDQGDDAATAMKFVLDCMARYRYPGQFKSSMVTMGRHYDLFTEQGVMAEFGEAKKNGADPGLLYGLLEDALYAKYLRDPMELQRALLKLELTPAPHLTSKEALEQGYIGTRDLLQKDFINDFFARFERENGSILEFGSAITHQKKIAAIQAQFDVYITEKLGAQLPARYPSDLDPTGTVSTGRAANPGASATREPGSSGAEAAAGSSAAAER